MELLRWNLGLTSFRDASVDCVLSGDIRPKTVVKTGKVLPYSLPSVVPVTDPSVQAVSPQVTFKPSTRR